MQEYGILTVPPGGLTMELWQQTAADFVLREYPAPAPVRNPFQNAHLSLYAFHTVQKRHTVHVGREAMAPTPPLLFEV